MGNAIIAILLTLVLLGLGLVLMNIEDLQTTLRLMDVAC